MQRPFYQQLALEPLHGATARELVYGLLGVDVSLTPLVSFIAERSGGNPFFVEEVVRALLEDGTIGGRPGAYRLSRPLDEVRVPPSVHAVMFQSRS